MSMISTTGQPPQLRNAIVHRPRLVSRLGHPLPKLLLFCAPAGFGKTTLALDWLAQLGTPVSWLSLDTYDNEPGRLLGRLTAALRRLDPAPGEAEPAAAWSPGAAAPDEALLMQLAESLVAQAVEGVIVVDDYHHIEEPAAHGLIRRLVENLGGQLHLLLLTRVDPPLSLGRLRVSGELLELREQDLRFTRDETSVFFRLSLPDGLPEHLVGVLEERTEGWAAGLRMAALALMGDVDPEVVVMSFTGNHHFVMDYLLEEALARQPDEIQRFLMQTSVLSRFDAELCATVTADRQASRLLDSVAAANLFLVPLDAEHRWFRYHHLFADLLEYRLRRLHPEQVDLLHQRAADWLETHGELQEALRHASRITAPAPFLSLLDRRGMEMITRSELATFERWMRYVPEPETLRYPMLLAALAWFRLLTERRPLLEPILAAAEAALTTPAVPYTPAREEECQLLLSALRAYHLRFQNRPAEAIEASEAVLAKLSDAHRLVRGTLLFNLARAHMQLGEVRPAHALLQRSFEENLSAGTDYLVLASLGHQGAVLLQTDGVARAREALQAALSVARERHLETLPACGIILYQLGRVHYIANELDAAQQVLEKAVELGRNGHEPEVLYNGLVHLARVHTARGEFELAGSLLQRAELIGQVHNANPFDTTLAAERAWHALRGGDAQPASELGEALCGGPPLQEQAWTPASESEAMVTLQLAVMREPTEPMRALAGQLCQEAQARRRGLAACGAAVAEMLLHPRDEARWKRLDDALAAASRAGYVRCWLDFGAPVRSLLRRALEQPLSPEAAAFARNLLAQHAPEAETEQAAIPKFLQPLLTPLTEREQEVLHHLARGQSNKAIARSMYVSIETIKTHLKHIFAKLGASNRAGALERARQLGLHRQAERI